MLELALPRKAPEVDSLPCICMSLPLSSKLLPVIHLTFASVQMDEFVDLLGRTEADIEGLVYDDPEPPVRKKIPVPRGYTQRLKILIASKKRIFP